jgi:hypothetical protein
MTPKTLLGDVPTFLKVCSVPLQQESKALTRVRSQIRVPAISSSSAGTACRFNGYDERCRPIICKGTNAFYFSDLIAASLQPIGTMARVAFRTVIGASGEMGVSSQPTTGLV